MLPSHHHHGNDHVGESLLHLLLLCLMILASSVSDIVSLKDRGKYQGINEAVIALSNGFGPVIGGLFAEYTTW